MRTRRTRFAIASILLGLTALAGAAARAGRAVVSLLPGGTTYAAPGGGPVTFTGHLDRTSVLRGGDGLVRMELAIGGGTDVAERAARRPTDLVVVLDRSGSMEGEKIEHARAAVRELIGRLGVDDRFALVTYSDAAALAVPLAGADDRARA